MLQPGMATQCQSSQRGPPDGMPGCLWLTKELLCMYCRCQADQEHAQLTASHTFYSTCNKLSDCTDYTEAESKQHVPSGGLAAGTEAAGEADGRLLQEGVAGNAAPAGLDEAAGVPDKPCQAGGPFCTERTYLCGAMQMCLGGQGVSSLVRKTCHGHDVLTSGEALDGCTVGCPLPPGKNSGSDKACTDPC